MPRAAISPCGRRRNPSYCSAPDWGDAGLGDAARARRGMSRPAKSGGSTAPGTAPSIPSPARSARCSKSSPTATATSATPRHRRPTGSRSDFDAAGRLSLETSRSSTCLAMPILSLRADAVHGGFRRRPDELGHRGRSRPHRDFRREGRVDAGHRRSPAPRAASAAGWPGAGASRILRPQQRQRPIGIRPSQASSS